MPSPRADGRSPATLPAVLGMVLLLCGCQVTTSDTMTGPDPHSFARPDQVAVQHLDLELQLDFAQRRVRGNATLTLARHDRRADLVLDSQGLRIGSITDALGVALHWRQGPVDPHLGAALIVQLNPNTTKIVVHYETAPDAAALQWLDPAQTSGPHPFLFTQGQAILTRSWIPLQDSPAVRATWSAVVTAPSPLRPVMSAMRSEDLGGGRHRFAMERAVPSYLIALACGELQQLAISPRCAVWAEPAVLPRAARELDDLERMLASCEAQFGAYRWGRYDVLVLPPSFPFGGMENPCLTFATPTILAGDKSLVALIAHELAHSWSGNLVTNATWSDFWLNEGFTVYLEQRIMEQLYGRDRADMEIALAMQGLRQEMAGLPTAEQVLHIDLRGRNPDDGMTGVPYEKGAAFLRRLEQLIGRARMDSFLRSWFDAHAFRSVTTAQFETWLAQHLFAGDPALARQLDVRRWLHEPGLPEDAPTPQSAAFTAVDAVRTTFLAERRIEPVQAACRGWTTQEWLHFLTPLAGKADAALLAQLDAGLDLTATGNCEILCIWLQCAIRGGHAAAMPRLEAFLHEVGRRKYLKPLYEALAATPEGKARALAIYRTARPRYHTVSTRTLDELLGQQPGR